MTLTMSPRVETLVHWRSRHRGHVRTDWDLHGHPRPLIYLENALLSREMDRL